MVVDELIVADGQIASGKFANGVGLLFIHDFFMMLTCFCSFPLHLLPHPLPAERQDSRPDVDQVRVQSLRSQLRDIKREQDTGANFPLQLHLPHSPVRRPQSPHLPALQPAQVKRALRLAQPSTFLTSALTGVLNFLS